MMKFFSSFIFLLFTSSVHSQEVDKLASDIVYYSDVLINTSNPSSKARAQKKLAPIVESFLKAQGSFSYEFQEDVWLSFKKPENESFKVITWEHDLGDKHYDYYGYVQFPDGSFIKLSDHSDEIEDANYMNLDPDYWFGALYYNLSSFKDERGETYHVLFGISKKDEFTTRKIAEVFSVVDNELTIGKPVFENKVAGDYMERLILTYSSEANVSLNYNYSLNKIVFDHLIQRMGLLPGQGPTQLPDGSYCGYEFKEGKLHYIDKLYNQVSVVPPRTRKREKNRDILGKKKN